MVTTDPNEKKQGMLRFKQNRIPSSCSERRSSMQQDQQRRRHERFDIIRNMRTTTQTFMEHMEKTAQQQIQETCAFVKQHIEHLEQLIRVDNEVDEGNNKTPCTTVHSKQVSSIDLDSHATTPTTRPKDRLPDKPHGPKFPKKDTLPCIANILHYLFYAADLGPKRTIDETVAKMSELDPSRLHLYRTKFHQVRKRYKTHDVYSPDFFRAAAQDYDKWTHYNYPELLELVFVDGVHTQPDANLS
jgi:hypothetical protein